jgi:dUTP pyrophosphatase
MSLTVALRRLPHAEGLPLPARASPGAAGLDLRDAVRDDAPLTIPPGGRALVPTGFVLALPEGTEGQVRPRSGLALRHGVTVLNAPGTIDSDFRGEVQVLLVNLGEEPFRVTRGQRIAQLVVARAEVIDWHEVVVLSETGRGAGGFGSTGGIDSEGER